MCGICGELAFGSSPADRFGLESMRLALAHRGPDDAGSLADGPVALGHTRLAIIDLTPQGCQPLHSDDGSKAIVFNGEIYNYRELRGHLESLGRTFRTATDTEVAATALAQWGVAALERFIGMFAMAVWDSRERSLLLARDRLGVKPLYYALSRDRLLFASEPRSILAHPAFDARVDQQALASYLMAGYFPGGQTIYAGVRKLPPGTWLKVRSSGDVESGRYWSLAHIHRGDFTGSFEEAGEELRALFRSAFGYRLVADVPVGMFLSGGVDSSLVAAVLKKDLGAAPIHFTLGFGSVGASGEKSFDETDKAAGLCARLGLPHVVRRVDETMAQSALLTFVNVYDEPFGDPSGIPTFLVSALARERVKVALSADGGDELFCGYTGQARYPGLYRKLQAAPPRLRRALAALARAVPWRAALPKTHSRAGQARADRIVRFFRMLGATSPRDLLATYAARGFFPNEAASLLGVEHASLPDEFLASAGDAVADEDGLSSMLMAHDVQFWLPDDILTKVDRASMHVGLECRDPLLDHRIAEFAASLPLSFLRSGTEQKRILRHILGQIDTPALARQGKQGFEIPLAAWLDGAWRPVLEEHLSRERLLAVGVLDPDQARGVVERFQTNRGESAQRVWLLLAFQMWAGRWLPGRGA
jgi:asparagine synthase (glutamine-hydrolysing)